MDKYLAKIRYYELVKSLKRIEKRDLSGALSIEDITKIKNKFETIQTNLHLKYTNYLNREYKKEEAITEGRFFNGGWEGEGRRTFSKTNSRPNLPKKKQMLEYLERRV